MFLNPFSGIIEDRRYPLSRVLRTSLFQKFNDSFHVFAGSRFFSSSSKLHVGLFDYLTLFTSTAMLALLALSMSLGGSEKKPAATIGALLFLPILVLNLPFLAARHLVSGVCAIVFFPITAAIHWWASTKAEKDKEQIKSLKGTTEEGDEVTISDSIDLFDEPEFMLAGWTRAWFYNVDIRHDHNMQSDMLEDKVSANYNSKPWKPLAHYATTSSHKYLFFPKLIVGDIGDHDGVERIPFKIDLKTQSSALESLRKLNVRNILVNELQGDIIINSTGEPSAMGNLLHGMY